MKIDLSKLALAKGAKKKKVRLGRGESSGLGKTSGKGGKGQTARTGGKVKRHFEGGQMPLYRRVPKIGFTSRKRILGENVYSIVNLSALNVFNNGDEVTVEKLTQSGLVKIGSGSGLVKVLFDKGFENKKLSIKVHKISETAKQAVLSCGGSVELL